MKHLLITGLLLASSNVFASKMVNIKTLTNPKLEATRAALVKLDIVTHASTKKILELKGSGKTPLELRTNAIAQALHTTCPFFDDGVSVSVDSKDAKGSEAAAETFLADAYDAENGEFAIVTNSVKNFNAEAGVEVYSGEASGNNTVGTVLGIYDTKNNEIAVFANTNCGSDD